MDSTKIRSSIRDSLKQKVLLKGTILSGLGVSAILLAGALLPASSLKIVGLPIFIFGIACITIGLLPYRRITKLEVSPHEILITESSLEFYVNKVLFLSIPISSIEQIEYVDRKDYYGIGILLKKPTKNQVKVFNRSLFSKIKIPHKFEIFFPYFSKKSFEQLKSYIFY